MDILPVLIEIGFDVIDPIQPEWLDPVVVKQLYGDQITLHGYGSLQWTLPFGTLPRGGRASDRNLRDRRWMGGLRVSNAIGGDVPPENVVTRYGAARDDDLSALSVA